MSTDKDNREYDRDQELQNKDRDQLSNENLEQENQPKEGDSDKIEPQNPDRLQDNDHKMNKRTNEVQGSVSYDQNLRQEEGDSNDDVESLWKDIEGDYRRRYPDVTDEDVNYKSGEFDSMTGRIAKRTNRNRQDVNNEIREWHSPKNS